MTEVLNEIFYTAGYVEDDLLTTVDIAEEWDSTFFPIQYATAEEVKDHWERTKAHFKYSHKKDKDKILKITIQVEEVGDLL